MESKIDSNLITKSIIKTYRKSIWKKFLHAIDDYQLLKENDKIAVCMSGGKDSFLMALLFKELQRHSKFKFDLVFLVMNPGYSPKNLKLIKENAKNLDIDIHIFDSNIFNEIKDVKNACYLCARKRRGFLYNEAKRLGCNKISLGHHFDDVIETILLNMFYAGTYGSMMPKLKSDHYEGMELIRPLYLIHEYDILKWVKYNNLEFLDCACSVTKKKNDSKRNEIKELIKELKLKYKNIDNNIFKSTENVNLNTIISYTKDGENKRFLDDYEKKEK